jgi:hypothetical protein
MLKPAVSMEESRCGVNGVAVSSSPRRTFNRNLRDGFYDLGAPTGDPRFQRPPRQLQAWDELTALLSVA